MTNSDDFPFGNLNQFHNYIPSPALSGFFVVCLVLPSPLKIFSTPIHSRIDLSIRSRIVIYIGSTNSEATRKQGRIMKQVLGYVVPVILGFVLVTVLGSVLVGFLHNVVPTVSKTLSGN